ncbi:MAG: aminotransferase [Oceanospirillaceae bacterium]|nr:aminotransferase [Oceanospirillaceae bacterium]
MPQNTQQLAATAANTNQLLQQYRQYQDQALNLDMTRGKPCSEQLDLANPMLNILDSTDYMDASGIDCRNYGGLSGISEAKTLFSAYMEVTEQELFIGANTSLGLMHDIIARSMSHGCTDSAKPWNQLEKISFLCPAPGYDRHFSICEHFNIKMIPIDLLKNGDPDLDEIERLVSADSSIKGMWFVPKYGNPSGLSVSDAAVDRLAAMECAAPDFKIIWDNAYNVHHLTAQHSEIKNLLRSCEAAGNANRVFMIGSTSKISFAGAGIAVIGSSCQNIQWLESHTAVQTIGSDKINQLRHVRFFKDLSGIHAHMEKHAAILVPKFAAVQNVLSTNLAGLGIAQWSTPTGGYFVSLNVMDNCAAKIIAMAKDAGVILTEAGATFPYKNDPRDRNIRIAPTLPNLMQINLAMEVLCICIQLVTIEAQSTDK